MDAITRLSVAQQLSELPRPRRVTIRLPCAWPCRCASDLLLDERAANIAASLHAQHHVSVPDAHIGAAIATCAHTDDITVMTSDPGDCALVAGETRIQTVSSARSPKLRDRVDAQNDSRLCTDQSSASLGRRADV